MKHLPQRTCIACRTVRPKRELVRVVHALDGRVEPDPTGKKSGRGAYLCKQRECWDAMLASHGRLEQALKLDGGIAAADFERLAEFASSLAPREPPAQAAKTE